MKIQIEFKALQTWCHITAKLEKNRKEEKKRKSPLPPQPNPTQSSNQWMWHPLDI
jgi:hypothetical protein